MIAGLDLTSGIDTLSTFKRKNKLELLPCPINEISAMEKELPFEPKAFGRDYP